MRHLVSAALATLLGAALLIAPVTATASTTTPAPAPTTEATQVSDDGVAPIAVLLDTSGSMNEDDGTGTVKLRGAKNAVRDILRNLSPTTVFGLRTYPAAGGCDEGRYVREPAPLTNSFGNNSADSVLGSIEGITADGSTPTGEALRALADDLTARGYTAATIVLVSDGESTCSTPPCDVAKQLVQEGFDVTVPTIGFRTSAAGSEELACVAEATGGVYLNAGDSAELAEHLDSLVRAQLELTVRYDPAPLAGGSTKITATLQHKGGEDAKNVRLTLTFADALTPNKRRAAVPPMVRVGNIPAGQSVKRSWIIGTGPAGAPATTFTMSAWGTNTIRVAFEGEFTAIPGSISKSDFGPIFDTVSPEHPIVIFGDSYSSGEGVGGDYHSADGVAAEECHRSHRTYLGSAFSESELKILACSGALTNAFSGASDRASASQRKQLTDLGLAPAVALMTFGGNDIGFADIVAMCLNPFLPGGCANEQYLNRKVEETASLATKLAAIYREAWSALNTPEMRAARNGEYAPLIVLPYPKVTWEPKLGVCHQFDSLEQVVADVLASKLNGAVSLAVHAVAMQGYEVYLADPVETAVRPDHTLCEVGDKAYVNGWLPWPNRSVALPESVHPKVSGYEAVTRAIAEWSRSVTTFTPSVSAGELNANIEASSVALERMWPTTVSISQRAPATLIQGGAVNLRGEDLTIGSPATVTLYSHPVVLGTLIADDNGVIDGTLQVPEYVSPGQHTLVVSALSADGGYIEKRIPVSVIFPTPGWAWGALALGAVLLLGAVALALVGFSSRRRTTPHPELP